MRIWFSTVGTILTQAGRQQEAIGVSVVYSAIVENPPDYTGYIRQYLGDSDTMNSVLTPINPPSEVPSAYEAYIRQYLGDN